MLVAVAIIIAAMIQVKNMSMSAKMMLKAAMEMTITR